MLAEAAPTASTAAPRLRPSRAICGERSATGLPQPPAFQVCLATRSWGTLNSLHIMDGSQWSRAIGASGFRNST